MVAPTMDFVVFRRGDSRIARFCFAVCVGFREGNPSPTEFAYASVALVCGVHFLAGRRPRRPAFKGKNKTKKQHHPKVMLPAILFTPLFEIPKTQRMHRNFFYLFRSKLRVLQGLPVGVQYADDSRKGFQIDALVWYMNPAATHKTPMPFHRTFHHSSIR